MGRGKTTKTLGASTPGEARYRKIVAEKTRTGESLAELARRHGIPKGTMSWWMHELRRRDEARKPIETTPALLPVRVTSACVQLEPVALMRPAGNFEVALVGGRRVLRIPASFDPSAVRALVEAVEGAPC